ncbi:hypothetical protein GGS26DRAFT_548415 [Hypomontagnella submonticulosa]|nr:hypothetical protein GGS26DRAFT_548415 [Hypomontagnella submonticulosa]
MKAGNYHKNGDTSLIFICSLFLLSAGSLYPKVFFLLYYLSRSAQVHLFFSLRPDLVICLFLDYIIAASPTIFTYLSTSHPVTYTTQAIKMKSAFALVFTSLMALVAAAPLNINLGAYSPALVVGDGAIGFHGEEGAAAAEGAAALSGQGIVSE